MINRLRGDSSRIGFGLVSRLRGSVRTLLIEGSLRCARHFIRFRLIRRFGRSKGRLCYSRRSKGGFRCSSSAGRCARGAMRSDSNWTSRRRTHVYVKDLTVTVAGLRMASRVSFSFFWITRTMSSLAWRWSRRIRSVSRARFSVRVVRLVSVWIRRSARLRGSFRAGSRTSRRSTRRICGIIRWCISSWSSCSRSTRTWSACSSKRSAHSIRSCTCTSVCAVWVLRITRRSRVSEASRFQWPRARSF